MRKTVFLQPNFKRLGKLGKHPLSFSQGQLDPGSPAQAYLTVTDEAVCRGVGRRRGEGGGGRWEVPERDGCHPQEELWLIGLGLLPVSAGHPRPRGSPLWVHIFTPGQIARQARKSSPPIPTSPPCPPSTFPPSKSTLSGATSAAFWPLLLRFRSLSLPLLLSSADCVHISVVPYSGLSKKHHFAILWIYAFDHYILGFSFHNSLYVWLMCAFKKKKKKQKKKTLHSGFKGEKNCNIWTCGESSLDASSVHLHLMTNETGSCGPEVYCTSDQRLSAMITAERRDRDKMTVLTHNR